MKICTKCGKRKRISSFPKDGRNVRGSQPCKMCKRKQKRYPRLRLPSHSRRHRIDNAAYELLMVAQDGRCGVCRKMPGRRRLDVDHDHSCCPGRESCGKCIRGLLCWRCNMALGMVNDDPILVHNMAVYLSRSKSSISAAWDQRPSPDNTGETASVN